MGATYTVATEGGRCYSYEAEPVSSDKEIQREACSVETWGSHSRSHMWSNQSKNCGNMTIM